MSAASARRSAKTVGFGAVPEACYNYSLLDVAFEEETMADTQKKKRRSTSEIIIWVVGILVVISMILSMALPLLTAR